MIGTVSIRAARAEDVPGISALIQTTVRVSNAQDYPAEVIARVAEVFSEETVRGFLDQRRVLVATEGASVIGTASLDGAAVRSVFVHPDRQGRGIGQGLMARVEALARDAGIEVLRVPASLTAQAFYARLGYAFVREVRHGEERTIVMEKALG